MVDGQGMSAKHQIPVIRTMLDALRHLEANPSGVRVNDLAAMAGASRSTIYRILKTLEAEEMVVAHGTPTSYALGPRFLSLAASIPQAQHWNELVVAAHPAMNRLAAEIGETVKLSVLDTDRALCIACVRGPGMFSLNTAIGQHFPLHAGAASKVLLSVLVAEERDRILPDPLPVFTASTIVRRDELDRELARVLEQGWAEDCNEFMPGVRAVGAPIRARTGVAAALSTAFVSEQPAGRIELIQTRTTAVAEELSRALALMDCRAQR